MPAKLNVYNLGVEGVNRVDSPLHKVDGELELGQRKDAFPSELSRGMKQKLMVAMALLHRPEALLLDEPLTGLDPPAMRRMKDRIRATAASGVAVILSSHMLHLVEELCRRVAILVSGRKVLDGTLDEIRGARPAGGRGDLRPPAGAQPRYLPSRRDGLRAGRQSSRGAEAVRSGRGGSFIQPSDGRHLDGNGRRGR